MFGLLAGAAYAPPPGVSLPPVIRRAMARLGVFDDDPVPQFSVGSPGSLKLLSLRYKRSVGEILVGESDEADRLEVRIPSERQRAYTAEGEQVSVEAFQPDERLIIAYRGEPTAPQASAIFRLGVSAESTAPIEEFAPIPVTHPKSVLKVRPVKGWRGDAVENPTAGSVDFLLHPRSYRGALEPQLLVIDEPISESVDSSGGSSQLAILGERDYQISDREVKEHLVLFLSGDEIVLASFHRTIVGERALVFIGFSKAEEFADFLPVFRSTVRGVLGSTAVPKN